MHAAALGPVLPCHALPCPLSESPFVSLCLKRGRRNCPLPYCAVPKTKVPFHTHTLSDGTFALILLFIRSVNLLTPSHTFPQSHPGTPQITHLSPIWVLGEEWCGDLSHHFCLHLLLVLSLLSCVCVDILSASLSLCELDSLPWKTHLQIGQARKCKVRWREG